FRADALDFAGPRQPPPFASARFDTSFFLARAPAGQEASVQPGELASGEWIAPARALERWKKGEATFAAPILCTLEELTLGEQGLAARLALAPERAGQPDTARHVRGDRLIGDGDTIALARDAGDWTLHAFHTPGHTRGHLCFLHERTRSLFTGDHITGGAGTVIIDPPEGDMTAYMAS